MYLLLALISITSCNDQRNYAPIEGSKIAQEKLTHPHLLEWVDTLMCTGRIDIPPQNLIDIHAASSGFVKQVYHYPGTEVQKGTLIAVLEHPDFVGPQRELLEAKARQEYLSINSERMKELSAKDAVSMRAYQEAESEYQINKARIEGLSAQLRLMGFNTEKILRENRVQEQLYIRAPVNGTITLMNINQGKLIQKEDLLVQMVDMRHKHLELTVFASDLARLKKGMKVRFKSEQADQQMLASIFLINPMVDLEKNSVQVHAHLSDEDEHNPSLRPGTYVQANIEMEKQYHWALERACVHEKKGNHFVSIIRDGKREEIMVKDMGVKNGFWLLPHQGVLADSNVTVLMSVADGHAHE